MAAGVLLTSESRTSRRALTIPEGSKVQQHPAVWGRQILSDAHWDAGWGHLAEWQGQHISPAEKQLRPEPARLEPACNPPNTEDSFIHTDAVAPPRSTRSIISWWHWGQGRSEVSTGSKFRKGYYGIGRRCAFTHITSWFIWSLYKGSLTLHVCTDLRPWVLTCYWEDVQSVACSVLLNMKQFGKIIH